MPDTSADMELLVASTQLVDLGFTQLSATRRPVDAAAGAVPDETVSPTFGLRLATRDEPGPAGEGGFQVFLRCDVESALGMVAVELVATYEVDAPASSLVGNGDILLEYVNEVAVMVCLPFLRQALADLTQRVFNNPLVMPIMQRGTVRFEAH